MQRAIRFIVRWASIGGWLVVFMGSSAMSGAHASSKIDVDTTCLPLPSGEVLLTVHGTNTCGNVHLDIATIQSLPAHSLRTTTAVTDGIKQFDGVLMRDVLGLVGADGLVVQAHALNNYSVDIPITDFYDYDVLLATHMDGERLLLTGKGPFWIVYPRDDWRQLQDIRYDYRWVWQLHRLTVK